MGIACSTPLPSKHCHACMPVTGVPAHTGEGDTDGVPGCQRAGGTESPGAVWWQVCRLSVFRPHRPALGLSYTSQPPRRQLQLRVCALLTSGGMQGGGGCSAACRRQLSEAGARRAVAARQRPSSSSRAPGGQDECEACAAAARQEGRPCSMQQCGEVPARVSTLPMQTAGMSMEHAAYARAWHRLTFHIPWAAAGRSLWGPSAAGASQSPQPPQLAGCRRVPALPAALPRLRSWPGTMTTAARSGLRAQRGRRRRSAAACEAQALGRQPPQRQMAPPAPHPD